MNISQNGIEFIEGWEGLRLHLYNDPAGHCTIGIGHLVHLGHCDGRSSEAPYRQGLSKAQAETLFRQDVARFEQAVNNIGARLNQNQFDALVDFAYNLGAYIFVPPNGGVPMANYLRAGRYDMVCGELRKFVTAVGIGYLDALRRRREDECRLFNKPAVAPPVFEEEDDEMAFPLPHIDCAQVSGRPYRSYYETTIGGLIHKVIVSSSAQRSAWEKSGIILPPRRLTLTEVKAVPSAPGTPEPDAP